MTRDQHSRGRRWQLLMQCISVKIGILGYGRIKYICSMLFFCCFWWRIFISIFTHNASSTGKDTQHEVFKYIENVIIFIFCLRFYLVFLAISSSIISAVFEKQTGNIKIYVLMGMRLSVELFMVQSIVGSEQL